MAIPDRRQEIMDVAKLMVQASGYNALSFRDIATEVGVKSASVHYHFPTKGDLGAALARKYTEDGVAYLDAVLAEEKEPQARLRRYIAIFRGALENDNRMCLCGIMAAENENLPEAVRGEVQAFATANVRWLMDALTSPNEREIPEGMKQRALAIFAGVGGAQLLARGCGDIKAFDEVIGAYRSAGLIP